MLSLLIDAVQTKDIKTNIINANDFNNVTVHVNISTAGLERQHL